MRMTGRGVPSGTFENERRRMQVLHIITMMSWTGSPAGGQIFNPSWNLPIRHICRCYDGETERNRIRP